MGRRTRRRRENIRDRVDSGGTAVAASTSTAFRGSGSGAPSRVVNVTENGFVDDLDKLH